jgi:hypothetical protein
VWATKIKEKEKKISQKKPQTLKKNETLIELRKRRLGNQLSKVVLRPPS